MAEENALAEMISRWQELREQGQPVTPELLLPTPLSCSIP